MRSVNTAKVEFKLLRSGEVELEKGKSEDIAYKFKMEVVNDFIRNGLSGSGPDLTKGEHEQIFDYNISFNKYYDEAMDNILDLRIENLGAKALDLHVLQSKYFFSNELNNLTMLVEEVSSVMQEGSKSTLVPLNIANKHWVGLVFEHQEEGSITVKYMDPENKSIPDTLAKALTAELVARGYEVAIEEIEVAHQIAGNCGPEVIENFIWYLTGKRVSQEDAVKYHSKLVEQKLLRNANETKVEELVFDSNSYDPSDIGNFMAVSGHADASDVDMTVII